MFGQAKCIFSMLSCKRGVSAVEYALVAAFICLVIVISLRALGVEVVEFFYEAESAFPE